MIMSRRTDRPLVIAHRGFSAGHGENTAAAFEAAIGCGADFIETDVRLSNDGTLYCNHDPHLERTRGTDKTIAGLGDEALDALEIMRLSQVLELAKNRIPILLDLKLLYAGFPLVVLETVLRHGVTEDVVFGVRSVAQAAALHAEAPQQTMLGFLKQPSDIPAFFAAGGMIARLWEEDVTETAVEQVRQGDHAIWVTAGLTQSGEAPGEIEPARLRRLSALGIDGVLVNDPEMALRALRQDDGTAAQ